MREYTPENITDVVIEQMSTTPDPRMKEVMEAAVRHLHAFAREVKLTPAEWIAGIEFMTKVGQMCNPARQEFILLSDTVGLSALVNIMHDKTKMEEATGASLLGPFFRENTPKFEPGATIAKIDKGGQEVVLSAASPTPRARRCRAPRSPSGRRPPTAATTSRTASRRSTAAASSAPTTRATICCARCGRSATTSRSTARSARWSWPRSATASAPRTSIS